ncbi:MAG: DUF2141 domain-containing protein [Pseudomonadales bacterium]|nr:DUF2141 domain-containing protein [Pseudomonadales bacterium]MCP5182884.1 DUF2141 domain-containing protein [Pseudomonadales bacterium]
MTTRLGPEHLRCARFVRTALLAALGISPAAVGGTLTVTMTDVPSATGELMISIGDEAAFNGTAPYAVRAILPARVGTVTFSTDALPDGSYAARIMQDLNGNGELDSNFVGMPKEPWGMSNNARGNFGPPTFEDARFELTGDTTLAIQVRK